MPLLKELFEPGFVVPKGVILEYTDNIVFLDASQLETPEDVQVLHEFVKNVTDEIPRSDMFPELKIGNYLVATEYLENDELFSGSIIKLCKYRPLLHHVEGFGVLEGHPSYNFNAGWSLAQLYKEVQGNFWTIADYPEAMRTMNKRKSVK